ncbi:MAG: CPBP family intramembrane glutamic endopeptidase [Acidobacteriota bacterium]
MTVEPSLPPLEVFPAEPPPAPPTSGAFARDAILDLLAALGCAALVVFVYAVIAAIAKFSGHANQSGSMLDMLGGPWGIVGLLLATQLPLLYFALRRRRRNREKQRPLLDLFGATWGNTIPIGLGAGLGLTVLSGIYSLVLQRFLGQGAIPRQLDFLEEVLNNKPAVAVLIFIIAVLGPICEEIFFRGSIFGAARASGRTTTGVIVSATLFALVHLSPLLFPFYAAFAVIMCWLYAKTKTLAAPIAAHMTMNGIACLALLLSGGNQV